MDHPDFKSLTGFNCTVRIHYGSGARHPTQNSCRFSLGVFRGTQPCFLLEGVGITKKMRFKSSNLSTIAAKRINEGRLSMTFNNFDWETVAITDVKDKQALGQMHMLLESIFNGSFPNGTSTGTSIGRGIMSPVGRTPPPSLMVHRRSPTQGSGSEAKKKRLYNLSANPTNWRGASMVAAAQRNKNNTPSHTPSSKTTSFYGSVSPDSSHTPTLGTQERLSGGKYFNKSAKRNLALDLDNKGSSIDRDSDDFQPMPKYRVPHDSLHQSQRPPLSNLSTKQQGNVVKGDGKLVQLLRTDADPDGFANLGNTCYMNAVLQSLLGLYPFAEDLLNTHLFQSVHPGSLYRMMVLLLKCKRSKDSFEAQRILLKKIKAVISTNTPKFVGFRQQDAHELLSQCLDQLKDDVEHISNHGNNTTSSHGNGDTTTTDQREPSSMSPVVMNFESDIEHRIVCKECGLVTRNGQLNYDFPLQLPKSVLHKHNEQANLQQLFDQFFAAEEVEFNCTRCKCKSATLSHRLTKLPRILILHLKRYGYNSELSKNSKRVDNIRIPRYINVAHLSKEECDPPCPFSGPCPRDSSVLSVVLGQNEEKENLPTTPTTQFDLLTSDKKPSLQEDAIVILDSEDETMDTQRNPQTDNILLNDPLIPIESNIISKSRDTRTTPSRYNSLVGTLDRSSTSSTSKVCPNPCARDKNIDTPTLLGKRKSSERDLSSSRFDENLPLDNSGAHSHKPVHVEESISIDILTYCDDQDNSKMKNPKCQDPAQSNSKMDSVRTTEGCYSSEGSKASQCQITEEEAKKIRDKTLEDIDEMLATVPLEELTGFPKIETESCHESTFAVSTLQSPLSDINHTSSNGQSSELTMTSTASFNGGACLSDHKSITNGQSHVVAPATELDSVNGHELIVEKGVREDVVSESKDVLFDFNQEQDDLQRAMEESMKAQSSEFHLEGMSEEEQLRLALELSIQESLPVEPQTTALTTPTSSPCPGEQQRVHTTPTPEKNSLEAYRLVSIVNHIGRGSGGGHYISDVYSFSDHSWKTYNDSKVSEIREEDVRQRRQTTGYIFFFMHRSTFNSVASHFGR